MMKLRWSNCFWQFAIVVCLLLAGCDRSEPKPEPAEVTVVSGANSVAPLQTAGRQRIVSPIVESARSQVGRTVIYDPAYVELTYPGGDVPIDKGVCCDVVIRALRDALNMDLQKLVHEDMKAAFSQYPAIWGLKKPDRNIDHRRVPNLRTYFERQGYLVVLTKDINDYLPGDLITCTVGQNLAHIMVVSDRKGPDGTWLVIHNIGSGVKEEARLFEFPITGHYRIRQ